MAPRPCITCGTPTTHHPRCTTCETQHQQARNAARPHYAGDWDATAKATIDEHLETVGPRCPGYGVPPHTVDPTDLCCDHTHARTRTRLSVLCRSCNSRKGATEDKQQHTHT